MTELEGWFDDDEDATRGVVPAAEKTPATRKAAGQVSREETARQAAPPPTRGEDGCAGQKDCEADEIWSALLQLADLRARVWPPVSETEVAMVARRLRGV